MPETEQPPQSKPHKPLLRPTAAGWGLLGLLFSVFVLPWPLAWLVSMDWPPWVEVPFFITCLGTLGVLIGVVMFVVDEASRGRPFWVRK